MFGQTVWGRNKWGYVALPSPEKTFYGSVMASSLAQSDEYVEHVVHGAVNGNALCSSESWIEAFYAGLLKPSALADSSVFAWHIVSGELVAAANDRSVFGSGVVFGGLVRATSILHCNSWTTSIWSVPVNVGAVIDSRSITQKVFYGANLALASCSSLCFTERILEQLLKASAIIYTLVPDIGWIQDVLSICPKRTICDVPYKTEALNIPLVAIIENIPENSKDIRISRKTEMINK